VKSAKSGFISSSPDAMYHLDRLASGLPVLTAQTDGTASVTVLVFAGAGSRYETKRDTGIGHFLEHMFFKGGKKYRNTKEVSVAIDSIGGDFNAFTGKEYAGYYVKVAAEHADLACDVLSDMLKHATFPTEEIEKERGVIIEEARMYEDTPMYRAGWDFELLLYGDCPLGWDTIGTEELIRTVTQKDFQKHKDALYTPDNLVVTFGGRIDPAQAMQFSQKYFADIGGKKSQEFAAHTKFGEKRVWLRTKKTEQSHLVLGVPGVPSIHEDHFAHKLLAIILGGNMSSRMFLNIREAKGLCYYIATETDSYMDAGSLSTRAGVDQSRLHEAISLILNEYAVCRAKGIEEEELTRAKEYLKGKITLSLEDSEELAHFYGKQQLLYPKVQSLEDYFAAINAVTKEQVDKLAARLLVPEEMRLVVIGSEPDESKLITLLQAS
jgi:predicted Zn-dependent peptidase